MTLYPVGTNVNDIVSFDRSTKVEFACKHHPNVQYRSKQPWSSQVFPANEHTKWAEFGLEDMECDHMFRDDVWVTIEPYES